MSYQEQSKIWGACPVVLFHSNTLIHTLIFSRLTLISTSTVLYCDFAAEIHFYGLLTPDMTIQPL